MSIRWFIAGGLVLAVAAPATYAQRVVPAAPIITPHVAPPVAAAPRIEPLPSPDMAPKPAAPKLAAPESRIADIFGSNKEDEALSRAFDGIGGVSADDRAGLSGLGGARAAPPPAPGYSDLCRASPKPPWCEDEPSVTTSTKQ